MSLVVRAFPLLRPIDDLQTFVEKLCGDRCDDTGRFYRNYGISHESWHVQDTPAGPWVITVTVVDAPQEAAPRYAAASDEFDQWFQSRVLELSGVDPRQAPMGPLTRRVFEWSDDMRPGSLAA